LFVEVDRALRQATQKYLRVPQARLG